MSTQQLTRCQRWTLESLAAMAPTRPQATTVHDLARAQGSSARQTGIYLSQLHAKRLVHYRTRANGLLWWVADTGLEILAPPDE
ncbi:hypothetical protein [Nocardia rhizosphaerae]|uniref:Uncharacterized protein n=1 Tax=Nocardia rhizosphaerae TaxID=1691571 RepID=A0ABV8L307_9NOCA